MNQEKRQHLVPRCYLKNFAVKGKKEWHTHVFDKLQDKYYSPGIRNICVESEFYTFSRLPDEKKRFLEKYYSTNIESNYTAIYDVLTDPSVRKIDKKMRVKILMYVFSQFTRTSKLTNTFNNFWNQVLERGHQMINPNNEDQSIHFDGGGKIDFRGRTLEDVQKETEKANREFINLENFDRFYDLGTRRIGDIFSIYKVHTDHTLITSDNPVLSTNFMFDPASHFHLPLDEKHLLLLLPFQKGIDNKVINRSSLGHEFSYLQVTTNNVMQIENAERYVIGSKCGVDNAFIEMKRLDADTWAVRAQKFVRHLESIRDVVKGISQSK